MKRLISLLVAAAFLFSASAETVLRAEPGADFWKLTHALSWSEDENGGFTVRSDAADMTLEAFGERVAVNGSIGFICFYAELRGNTRTLLCYPVLNILLANPTPVNAAAASFSVDGIRYDFPVYLTETRFGQCRAEAMSIYLGAEGVEFLKKLGACDRVSVGLWGDSQFVQTIDRNEVVFNQRAELAIQSLNAVTLPDGYSHESESPFGAQSASLWEKRTGVKPMMEAHEISPKKAAIPGDSLFGLIHQTAPAYSIRALEELLIAQGRMMGPAQQVLTGAARSAVMREQARQGRVLTGCADDALVRAMQRRAEIPSAVDLPEPQYACESALARFSIDRWWTARAIQTSAAGAVRETVNADNVFLAADGSIQGLGAEELSLLWEATAEMVCDGGQAFPANLYCETDQGGEFSSTLGILARSRLVVAAEVPGYLADAGRSWRLILRFGSEEFSFELR